MELTIDPEVHDLEWSEQQEILGEMGFMAMVRQEIRNEKAKGKDARYARIAREFLPRMREIFHAGYCRREAQELINELCLEPTVPLSDLDVRFDFIDGIYQDVDSYGVPEISDVGNQWEADYDEVQRMVEVLSWFDKDDPAAALFGGVIANDKPTTEAIVVYAPKESDNTRIVQELTAMGYDQKTVGKVLANTFSIDSYEGPEWSDDHDARTSGPVEAMAEDTYDPAEVFEIKGKLKYLVAVHGNINPATKKGRKAQEKFSDLCRELSRYRPHSLAVAALSRDEFEEIAEFVPLSPFGTLQDFIDLFGDTLLDDAFFVGESEGVFGGNARLWSFSTNDEIADSSEIIEKASAAIESQVIDTFVDTQEEAEEEAQKVAKRAWLWTKLQELAHGLKIPYMNRDKFISRAKIEWTAPFARGVFGALATGQSDLSGAGYNNWRWETSPYGAIAYNYAFQKYDDLKFDERVKRSARAFWNAGKIVSISPDGANILKTSGETQLVPWNLVKWKIQNKEIPINQDDMLRLKKILKENHWGNPVVYM